MSAPALSGASDGGSAADAATPAATVVVTAPEEVLFPETVTPPYAK